MKHTTGEFVAILLATVILVAISIITKPSITGYLLYEFANFSYDSNIIIENSLQLKQHSYTTNWTTEETAYYTLIFAESNNFNVLQKLTTVNNQFAFVINPFVLKIRFNNVLENNDKINFYLAGPVGTTIEICDFDASQECTNNYASFYYPDQSGFYQATLSSPPTNEFAISSDLIVWIDYINASHTETIQHENTTYYYNSAEVETEEIEPENLLKWDLFTSDYTLNNQSVAFYYKTNEDYIEFTPPYNFSAINSSKLKFKLHLYSDNSSTPIINSLKINYIEYTSPCIEDWSCTDWNDCVNNTQTRICTDLNNCGSFVNKPSEEQDCTITQEEPAPAPSPGKPSVTRYSSMPSAPAVTEAPVSSPVKTQTITQEIEPLKEINKEAIEPETPPEKLNKLKYYVSFFLFILLIILAYSIYHKHKNKNKTFLYYY